MGILIFVVKRLDNLLIMKFLDCVDLILMLYISNNVNSKSRMLIVNLKVFMLMEMKIKMLKGILIIFLKINFFSRVKLMFIFIF